MLIVHVRHCNRRLGERWDFRRPHQSGCLSRLVSDFGSMLKYSHAGYSRNGDLARFSLEESAWFVCLLARLLILDSHRI